MRFRIASAFTLLMVVHAEAETLRLSDLSEADRVAIQRGYSIAEGACVFAIINEIDAYGGPAAMKEFSITFDDEPLVITDGESSHTCDGGVHTSIKGTTRLVVQVYDEDGQPTMQEP